jgi:tRNA modification GTPase
VDTIFALSSGRPPAAVSVIRISGEKAHDAGVLIAGSLPGPRVASVRALRDPRTSALIDDAIVLRFDRPASFTGENIVELQCHGGRAVTDAVLGALASIDGLRAAEPGEFTRRAFENGRIDLTEAEGLADLIEAETESQRKAALALAEGGLRKQIAEWQEQLLALSAQAERAIDYDEDDEPVDPALLAECASLEAELRSWLARPRAERLKEGVRVVIAGPPNAGKSSLLNAIVGEERAIVTAVPGTTRDHIEVPLALAGVPLVVTDTAGLRAADDQAEAIGIERAARLIEAADVLVWLGGAEEVPRHPRTILVHSKADLLDGGGPAEGFLPVSAVSGVGMGELLLRIKSEARSVLPDDGSVTLNRRQARHVEEAADALFGASSAPEPVLLAEHLRVARRAFDRLTGRSGVEEVLDAIFARFCLGK